MASFRFLHAADLHLDSPLTGLARRGEAGRAFLDASRRALENLVAAAIAEQVAFVLIAGDIYDGDWRDYATGHFFARQMGVLARAGIRVFTIRGNHDAESVVTRSLDLPSNVYALSVRSVETVRLDEFGVVLHGRGFASRHVPDAITRDYPDAVPGRFNIGLLHTSLTGREGHATYAPCTVEDLARTGYDYWALGHVHEREEIVAGGTTLVFPGIVQGRHARETGPKGATLVTVTDGRIAEIKPLMLDVARFDHRTIDLTGVDDPAGITARAHEAARLALRAAEGRPVALRLTFSGETPLHASLGARLPQISEDIRARAYEEGAELLVEKLRDRTTGPRAALVEVSGFDALLDAVAADPAFRAEIGRTLAELLGKTPEAARARLLDRPPGAATDEAAAPLADALAEEAVTEALELVRARLATGGGAP